MDSPFAIPHMKKYVKRHIVEDARKEEMMVFLEEDRKFRKSFAKKRKQHLKKLYQLNLNRSTSSNEFDVVFEDLLNERNEMQAIDAQFKMKTAELITEQEWELIRNDAHQDLEKSLEEEKNGIQISV